MNKFSTVVAIIYAVNFLAGCQKQKNTVTTVPQARIYRNAVTLTKLPKKHSKKEWPNGTVYPVTKGKPAPISGILLSENRAKDAAKLRIAYEELYTSAKANKQFLDLVLKTCDNQLSACDKSKKNEIGKLQSWWNRNKFAIGMAVGIIATGVSSGLLYLGISSVKK
jgi:hypothetical protein